MTSKARIMATLLVAPNVKLGGRKGKIKSKLMVLCFRMGLTLWGRKRVYVWVRWPVHRGQNNMAVWEIIQTVAAFQYWQPVLQCLVEMVENT